VIDSNLNIIFATQSILQQLKIPFTMASISEPIINKSTILSDTRSTIKFNELEYYKYINVHPIFDLIDDKSYWGWPVGKYLGGHNVKSFLKDKMGDRYKISKDDAHPNAKGHELIAKELHDHNML
jgi:lysophospholipase L1-like esterase